MAADRPMAAANATIRFIFNPFPRNPDPTSAQSLQPAAQFAGSQSDCDARHVHLIERSCEPAPITLATGITHDGKYRSETHPLEQAIFGEKYCPICRTRSGPIDRAGKSTTTPMLAG